MDRQSDRNVTMVGSGHMGERSSNCSCSSRGRASTSSTHQRHSSRGASVLPCSFSLSMMTMVCLLLLILSHYTQAGSLGLKHQVRSLKFEDFKNDVGLRKTDLVVIMDRSSSMNKQWFYQHVKKVTQGLIERYVVVHPDYVRIAFITFSKDVSIDIDGINFPGINKCNLMNGEDARWHEIYFKTKEEDLVGTNIIDSLKLARTLLESPLNLRKNVTKKVILLVTDGAYQVAQDPYAEQQALVDLGYVIYTIGLGSWHVTGNVRQLASRAEYYGNITEWNNQIKGGMRSPGPEADPLYVKTNYTYCGSCVTGSECYCEVLSGDYLCRCPEGYTADKLGCTKCKYHQFKDTVGDHPCTECPRRSGTYLEGSTSYGDCVCFEQSDPNCNLTNNPCKLANACMGDNEICVYTGPSYRCVCRPGYQWDSASRNCLIVKHCDDTPDQLPCKEGHCVEMAGDFTCECDTGFTGRLCNISINECRHPVCDNGGNCTDGKNYFQCTCPAEWRGHYCRERITTTTSTTTPTTTTKTTTPTTTTPTTTTPTTTTPTTTTPTTTTTTTTTKPTKATTVRSPNAAALSQNNINIVYIIAAVVGVGAILLAFCIALCCCFCCRKSEPASSGNNTSTMGTSTTTSSGTQMSVRFSKNTQRQSIYKSISQRFSGIWKRKTLRGGMWTDDDNTKTGAPSAPAKRRPDLIASSLISNDPKSHDMDEIVVSNEEIAAPTGMEGWDSYLEDLEANDIIKYGVIAHVDGEKVAKSSSYIYTPGEVDQAHELLLDRNTDVHLTIQGTDFVIETNTGDAASGRTTEDKAEPEVMLMAHTKKFIVALIAWDNHLTDVAALEKELQYIVDHISSEGY